MLLIHIRTAIMGPGDLTEFIVLSFQRCFLQCDMVPW